MLILQSFHIPRNDQHPTLESPKIMIIMNTRRRLVYDIFQDHGLPFKNPLGVYLSNTRWHSRNYDGSSKEFSRWNS